MPVLGVSDDLYCLQAGMGVSVGICCCWAQAPCTHTTAVGHNASFAGTRTASFALCSALGVRWVAWGRARMNLVL